MDCSDYFVNKIGSLKMRCRVYSGAGFQAAFIGRDMERKGLMEELENRIVELEIRLALQGDLLDSLNATVAKMQDALDLQQAQLRVLYQKMQQQNESGQSQPYSLADEVPPHY